MIVIDVETVPAARELIEAKMPEEIRSPAMPEEIANPQPPNFAEKCPKYASAKDGEEKRAAWILAAETKWIAKKDADMAKWQEKADAAKQAFFNKAALDARLGHAKLIGMRDTDAEIDRVWIWEENAEQATRIMTWYRQLPETHHGRDYKGRSLCLSIFPTEAGALQAFLKKFEEVASPRSKSRIYLNSDDPLFQHVITYFGHHFDFPFLYRRSWILGVPRQPFFMRGRFYEPYMIDLHETWQFGDRSEVSGGLEGMAETLGATIRKQHDSARFHEVYAKDPTDGIAHLLNDLDLSEFCAQRVGIIRPKRGVPQVHVPDSKELRPEADELP